MPLAPCSGITVFENPAFGSFRVVIGPDGEPQFAARDVAAALGIVWNGTTTIKHIPEEWRGVISGNTPSGEQEMLCLSEQGLYFFLARSNKPGALPFQKWLAGDVLPSIRRHGMYATSQTVEAMLADPDTAITLLQNLKKERERRAALEAQSALDRPKVVFADAVDASHTSILLGDFAKILHQNGVSMGQKRLFEWMRERGYLMKYGDSRNMPTQRSMEMKIFEIKERTINNPDGSIRITKTPKLTGKGQIYFVNLFKRDTGEA